MKFIYSVTLAGALIATAGVVVFYKSSSEDKTVSKRESFHRVLLMGKNLGLQRSGQWNLPGNSLLMTV
jgi:hypothetical protein